MPMHVVARGALIGGGVGAALALLRPGRGERTGSGIARIAKSVAEGAVAGAIVGFLVDRRLRDTAAALVAEHGPDLLDSALGLATQAYDTARPQVGQALEAARPAVAGLTTRLRAA